MRRLLPLLLLPLLAACGSPSPPLDEGELAAAAARAAAYREGEPLAAAEKGWEYADPWERRRVVFADLVSGYADRGEDPPPNLSRAFFVSMSLARKDAPPLSPEQRAFADRLAEQTADLFAGEYFPVSDSVSTDMEGVPVQYVSARDIRVELSQPSPGERVTSPLRLEGRAPGSWMFEGASRARLLADDGALLGEGTITAQGDWMTTELVPFTGEIRFAEPDSGLGWLHVEAANPSGLPENDDHVEMPVTFGPR